MSILERWWPQSWKPKSLPREPSKIEEQMFAAMVERQFGLKPGTLVDQESNLAQV